ncbi:hypothetical protein A2936_02110 [Candidatus Uhrbacteria bacterium RIFCSPLOWO2_01_FULL_47_25]|uniref:Nucleotidyl transferase AbiEii/AbiGii toxin family protein n=2 Tax=Patescibacteria group TaxID=1783273 RepID=A0A1F7USR3_9BACT|nr:MAG: hypothetical protein A2693_03875 [Candidatus Curtissbacteria bacterium RIFCSPHIGHO2_01_FULL_40_12]OGL81295.1 MAG: hypothetical protein A2936_02110 [Candidatus Uhrbacteria bacterium RIFCSPLOWO2_01_FULL_47_25]
MIDTTSLNNLARAAAIDRYTILREYIQILFLDNFYHAGASRKIIFKGGTALKILFGSPRFSEDLDFTTKLPQSAISRLVNQTITNLQAEAPGIRVKTIKSVAGFSQKISFPTDFTPIPLTIKLDFSAREPALTNYQNTITTNLPVFSSSLITALSPEEIMAEKIRAITSRNKGRDIFDLWFLLKKSVRLDKKLITAKFRLYREKFSLAILIGKIKQFDQKQLTRDITKFLPLNHRQVIPQLKKLTVEVIQTNAA